MILSDVNPEELQTLVDATVMVEEPVKFMPITRLKLAIPSNLPVVVQFAIGDIISKAEKDIYALLGEQEAKIKVEFCVESRRKSIHIQTEGERKGTEDYKNEV